MHPAWLILSLAVCGGGYHRDLQSQAAPTYLQAILQGRGSPLVMLGGGEGAKEFEPHARELAEDHRVIRLQTITGERAQAGEPLPPDYSVRTESAALARTLDHLDIDSPVDLVGRSYGALVALDYALDHPHRVHTLTLMEPPAFWVVPDGELRQSAEMQSALRRLAAVAEHSDDPDRLKTLRRPVLIMAGAGTVSFQRRINDILASHLPIVERVELPGGDSSSSSAAEAFVAALKTFLAQHRFD